MAAPDPAPPHGAARFSHRAAARHGEVRLPPALAVLAAAAMQALLPDAILTGPRWLLPVVELALLAALVAVNPRRLTREDRWSRVGGLALVAVLIVANLADLGLLLHALVTSGSARPRDLLVGAAQVVLTNVIAFALVYWELDRGGAVARLRDGSRQVPADFLFPQDDPVVAARAMGGPGRWMPTFVDYLYLSVTNSTAFSPTDTLPLSSRAKLLMALQGIAALVTSLLVVARAVNVLT